MCAFAMPQIARADNLILNGDLSQGVSGAPAHWRSEAWQEGPAFSTYRWIHSASGPDEIEITNLKPNDARWVQTLHLSPGWYHFTASVRTENVPNGKTGAALTIMEDGIISAQLHGTTDWQPVGFYLKVGGSGAEVIFACRLGGFDGLNTGRATCRDLQGSKVDEPPVDTSYKYDLDFIRTGSTQPSPAPASDNSAHVTFLLFVAALILAGILAGSARRKRAIEAVGAILNRRSLPNQPATEVLNASQRRIEIKLFGVSLLTFAYFYQASDHNTAARFDLIRSFLERRTIWIDGYCGYNTADLIDWHSHYYSNKAPGRSLTGIIPWLISRTLAAALLIRTDSYYWAFVTYLATVLSVSLPVALMAVLIYRFALLLGASQERSVALALTLAFGTIVFPHATEFAGESIATTSVTASFYLLATADQQSGLWPSLGAGVLAGWAGLCDYPSIVLSVILALYALNQLRPWKRFAWFALGAALIAMILFAYDTAAFGKPFFLSYEAYMLPGNERFLDQSRGFAGVTYPRLPVLWQVLFAPQRGLFFCNPVLILAIPGLYFFWRRGTSVRPEFATILASIVVFVLINGSYGDSIVYWGGGSATGPRHMLTAIPFMVLTLVFLPESWNAIFAFLALFSAFLMLMATTVEPHLPYEYEHPFRDFLWPAFIRGDLAYNKNSYFGGPPIAGDSVAFNLGKLIGLPSWMELWPLSAIWILAARQLLTRTNRTSDANPRLRNTGLMATIAMMFAMPGVYQIVAAVASLIWLLRVQLPGVGGVRTTDQRYEQVLSDLRDSYFADIVTHFDPAVQKQVSADQIQSAWLGIADFILQERSQVSN
jgi:hypothetical protein